MKKNKLAVLGIPDITNHPGLGNPAVAGNAHKKKSPVFENEANAVIYENATTILFLQCRLQ